MRRKLNLSLKTQNLLSGFKFLRNLDKKKKSAERFMNPRSIRSNVVEGLATFQPLFSSFLTESELSAHLEFKLVVEIKKFKQEKLKFLSNDR